MTAIEKDALIAKFIAENTALKAKLAQANAPRALSYKVSEKGALSVYGMGRFPVTLYKGQWERLFAHKDAIESFIKANEATLKGKDE